MKKAPESPAPFHIGIFPSDSISWLRGQPLAAGASVMPSSFFTAGDVGEEALVEEASEPVEVSNTAR